MARCNRCGHEQFSAIDLPVEPLYTIEVSAELIPFATAQALRDYIRKHHRDWPTRYRTIARQANSRRRNIVRLLSADEIRTLRSEVVRSTRRKRGVGTTRQADARN